jgi:hypothetical protein
VIPNVPPAPQQESFSRNLEFIMRHFKVYSCRNVFGDGRSGRVR